VSLKEAQLLGHLREAQDIVHSHQKTGEQGHHTRSVPFAHVRLLLAASLTSRLQCPRFSLAQCPPPSGKSRSGSSLLRPATAAARDHLGACLALLVNRAPQAKELSDADPVLGEKVIEVAGSQQFAQFPAPMTFGEAASCAPVAAVHGPLREKEVQSVTQAGLIAKGNQDIVPLPPSPLQAEGRLSCAAQRPRCYAL